MEKPVICTAARCYTKVYAKGLCRKHYERRVRSTPEGKKRQQLASQRSQAKKKAAKEERAKFKYVLDQEDVERKRAKDAAEAEYEQQQTWGRKVGKLIDDMFGVQGKFITLEGIDGVGKSTQVQAIQEALTAAGVTFAVTREPGGTALAEEIRALLLAERSESVAAITELLLMFAARSQHLSEVIRPQLAAGVWVVSERFTDATYAYQGGGRGLDQRTIAQLEQLVHGDLQPDLTILLDAPLSELGGRLDPSDRFEREKKAFFERVRTAYLVRAERHERMVVVVDAAAPVAEVRRAVIDALAPLLKSQTSKQTR